MNIYHSHTHNPQKKNSRLQTMPAVLVSLLLALSLMAGCSGTGTMYTPDNYEYEDEAEFADTGATAAADAFSTGAAAAAQSGGRQAGEQQDQAAEAADPDEEPRTLRADLEGTGSDLYTAQAVKSYYSFTLDDASFSLPCRLSDLVNAGWALSEPGGESTGIAAQMIPSYSFEYVDAFPSGQTGREKKIRLCLANFTENDLAPASCTICGIQVSEDDGAMLKTAFGAGIGDPLEEMTSVYDTDPSCYEQTKFADGTCTVRYHFSNGLNEGETIPVLAEAEEKNIAEFILAETKEDGSTIRSLSLFFFRLPE